MNETNEINNIDKTIDITFPKDMPVLLFTKEENRVSEDGKSYMTFYQPIKK